MNISIGEARRIIAKAAASKGTVNIYVVDGEISTDDVEDSQPAERKKSATKKHI